MTGIKEGIGTVLHGFISHGHGLVGRKEGKIRQAFRKGLLDGQARRWRRRFKADGQEDDVFISVSFRIFISIEGRIDDFYMGPFAAGIGQAHFRTGDAHEVTEGADSHAFFQGQPDSLVDIADRRDADRAARSGNDVDLGRQDLADALSEDFMGVGPADFHDADFRPVITADDIQGRPLLCFCHQSSSSRISSVSSASLLVILAIAMPAWTMT